MMHPLRPALRSDPEHHLSGFRAEDLGGFKGRQTPEIYNWLVCLKAPESTLPDDYPSPWSWPLAFEAQLFAPEHPLHLLTRQAWYSCLTWLVLHPVWNYTLRLIQLDLKASDHPAPLWQEILNSFCPSDSKPEQQWEHISLFEHENIPYCLSQPVCLLMPAADQFDYFAEARFHHTLSSEQLWLLLQWLLHSHDKLSAQFMRFYQAPARPVYSLTLQDLFSAFAGEVLQLLRSKDETIPQSWQSTPISALLSNPAFQKVRQAQPTDFLSAPYLYLEQRRHFHLPGPLQCFEELPHLHAIAESECPLRLKPSAGRQPQEALILISAASLPEGMDLQERIFESWRLSDLLQLQEHETNTHWFGQKFLELSRWIWAESIWLPTLHVFPDHESLPGAEKSIQGMHQLQFNGEPVLPLLPVAAWLLEYLTAAELSKRLRFSASATGIQVCLRLTLQHGHELELSRDYAVSEIHTLDNIPVFKLWPAINHPQIQSYWTYYTAFGQHVGTCLIRACAPAAATASFSASPRKRHLQAASAADIDMEIQRLNALPEAFVCTNKTDKDQNQELGLILLAALPRYTESQQTAVIAVDLGTTNTQALLKQKGQQETVKLQAKDLFSVTQSIFEQDLHEDFLSLEDITLPFLTLFKCNHLAPVQASQYQPLMDGHIYYVETIHTFEHDERIKTDLKWNTHDKRIYLAAFIEQLCMQLCLFALNKGAGQVRFCFSYPLAFSAFDLKAFERAVEVALKNLQRVFSPAIVPEVVFQSEGLAAAYYFARGRTGLPPARFHQGVVILDIGGGSTDITVIEGKASTLHYTSSIKFAGRDIFMQALLHHLPVLKVLGIPERLVQQLQRAQQAHTGLQPQLIASLDALVHEYETILFDNLAYCFDIPEVKGFIAHLALGVGGLFFYLGQILTTLHTLGHYQQNSSLPMIYLAGNGSRIFKWFERQPDEKHSPYKTWFLKSFLLFGQSFLGHLKEPLTYHSSSQGEAFKPEVAGGMLVDPGLLEIEARNSQAQFVAGEAFVYQQQSNQALSLISRYMLQDLAPEKLQFEALNSFWQAYQQWSRIFLAGQSPFASKNAARSGQQLFDSACGAVRHELRVLINACQQDPDKIHQIRDEQVLFMQGLKKIYFDYHCLMR